MLGKDGGLKRSETQTQIFQNLHALGTIRWPNRKARLSLVLGQGVPVEVLKVTSSLDTVDGSAFALRR